MHPCLNFYGILSPILEWTNSPRKNKKKTRALGALNIIWEEGTEVLSLSVWEKYRRTKQKITWRKSQAFLEVQRI